MRKSSSAKGTATLNDPNDPNRPGELIVNFGGFQRKLMIIHKQKTISKIEYKILSKNLFLHTFTYFFLAESTSTNYNVVDTDYENFAVVYSCNNKLFFKSGNTLNYILKVLLKLQILSML